jgi:hypothetical protein
MKIGLLFFADFSKWVLVEDISPNAVELRWIVELNAHIVVNGADGDGFFYK